MTKVACKFWLPIDYRDDEAPEAAVFGECRRHAPTPTPTPTPSRKKHDVADAQNWPVVQLDDWCGDFDRDAKKATAVLTWESKRTSPKSKRKPGA